MNFVQKISAFIQKNNSLLCIGLDTEVAKLPKHLLGNPNPQFDFNKAIVDATSDLVSSYKINSAFYEAEGAKGIEQLKKTTDYISNQYTGIPVILDAKRADIGNTNQGYVKFAFDYLNIDAITIHPYLGSEAIQPFLDCKDKGIIILCKTSNPGAAELQDLLINDEPLYKVLAKKVVSDWNKNNNCLLVIGATYPEEMKQIREITPYMFFLVPGIGAQGGDLEKVLAAGLTKGKSGLIINSGRAIIYASAGFDFAEKAREEAEKLRNEINKYR